MIGLYRLLRALKERYGDGKEPLPDSVRMALERFVSRSRAVGNALANEALQQQIAVTNERRAKADGR